MKLLLDLHSTRKTKTGVARYWENLKNAIQEEFPTTKIISYNQNDNVYIRFLFGLRNVIKLNAPDIVHVDTFAPIGVNIPIIITVHDLLYKDYPHFLPFRRRIAFNSLFKYSVEKADAIICNSYYTKKRLLYHFKNLHESKIFVTHFAASKIFRPLKKEIVEQKLRVKYKISYDYFLVIGNIEKRKNILPILDAYKKLKDKYMVGLVIVGEYENKSIVKEKLNYSEKTIFTGYITDAELNWLYNGARGVIYNSLYEGFGFPIVEAMNCKVPIICSDIPVFHEIAEGCAIFVKNKAEIAFEMEKLLVDDKYFEKYSKAMYEARKKFNWKKTARESYKIYQWALKK